MGEPAMLFAKSLIRMFLSPSMTGRASISTVSVGTRSPSMLGEYFCKKRSKFAKRATVCLCCSIVCLNAAVSSRRETYLLNVDKPNQTLTTNKIGTIISEETIILNVAGENRKEYDFPLSRMIIILKSLINAS